MRRRIVEEYTLVYRDNHRVVAQAWFNGDGDGEPVRLVVETRYEDRDNGLRVEVSLLVTRLVCKAVISIQHGGVNTDIKTYREIVGVARAGPKRLYEMIKAMAGAR